MVWRVTLHRMQGVAMTPQGWRFPPFIVVERGESLDEWQRRIQPDFITVVQVPPRLMFQVPVPYIHSLL